MEQMYLIQIIPGLGEFNVFSGTEDECDKELSGLVANGANPADFYTSINRFD